MKKITILIFCFILTINYFAQNTKRVLFVGNSYTYVNNLPALVAGIADNFGDTLIYDSSTPGGSTFQMHTTNSVTLQKIAQPSWDYVVLQAQSQEPSFPPSQVAANTYPYAKILVDSIKNANECAEPLFYMTWGRQNGDATNCPIYPPLCTYDGMQGRLRQSYLEMADSNNATCAPVGVAWKQFRLLYPNINLYQSDQSHPSLEGSYLAACVFYSTIFRKPSVGCTYTAGISTAVAADIQTIASAIVSDSASLWNLGHQDISSSFTYFVSGNTVQFFSNTINADSLNWDFGNGTVSTATNPTIQYGSSGNFTVSLVASNSCARDTFSQTLAIGINAISENLNPHGSLLFPNPNSGKFLLLGEIPFREFSILNAIGTEIPFTIHENGEVVLEDPIPGIYFLRDKSKFRFKPVIFFVSE